jgi:hypothetical protein
MTLRRPGNFQAGVFFENTLQMVLQVLPQLFIFK